MVTILISTNKGSEGFRPMRQARWCISQILSMLAMIAPARTEAILRWLTWSPGEVCWHHSWQGKTIQVPAGFFRMGYPLVAQLV